MKKSLFIKIYLIPSLIISPLFTMSMNSWFSIWMTLEFNLLTFIPILIFFNKYFKEISMKYFIIQAISSAILIFSSNSSFIQLNQQLTSMFIMMINLSLLIKMGAAPFHLWFINMMKNMSWMNCLILSTWQKIIPFMSLMYTYNKSLMFLMIFMSSISSAFLGLNHQSIRLIMSYSSINHISWMLFNLMISELMWMMYFLSYFIINMALMNTFSSLKIFYFNQMLLINQKLIKISILLNFFSISSLPPLFGFSTKWLSLYFLNWKFPSLITFIMIMMSIITFIFYIRLCLTILLNYNIKNKLILINKFFLNKISSSQFLLISFITNLWIISIWMF